MVVGLPPCSVDSNAGRLYSSIVPSQPSGIPAPSRSSPIKQWSKQCTGDFVVILFGIHLCQMPEEMELLQLSKRRN